MASKPRIGLTMRLELETRRFYLGRDYSEALAAAGAVPVHLPLIPDPEYIAEVMASLDGVLLPGSDTDVDPAYFDEDPHPRLGRVIPEKDLTDRLVLEFAEEHRTPVLAICYGMQALNVSRGGSLFQDIHSQLDGSLKHQQGEPLERSSHGIKVSEDGSLARIVSSTGMQNAKVNSHHHQSIRSVGRNLKASAWANDGIIECIEDVRDDRFVLGVQWHPELNWRKDVLSSAIFTAFVDAGTRSRKGAAG